MNVSDGFTGAIGDTPLIRLRALSDEIARMTAALEQLRELHKRGEVVDLRTVLDAGRK